MFGRLASDGWRRVRDRAGKEVSLFNAVIPAAGMGGEPMLVIQIDGLHVGDHVLMAAIGVWQRRQACPGRGRGGEEHGRRPGLDRRGLDDAAAAVHRRWREGAQQSDPKHLRCGRRHPALPGPQGP